MTIFNAVQFSAYDGISTVAHPAASLPSMPDDAAIRVFQHAYGRPAELQAAPVVAAERPEELPPATPATLAKVVAENLALAKELPPPMEVPVHDVAVSSKPPYPAQPGVPVTDNSGAAAPVTDNVGRAASMTPPEPSVVAAPVAVERPTELPPATPATLAKVIEENLALAQELPPPVEVPVPGAAVSSKPPYPAQPGAPVTDNSGAAAPVTDNVGAATPVTDNVGRAASMTPPEPSVVAAPVVAAERPTELPPATPATLAKVVEANLALAQELPPPVEVPVHGAAVSSKPPYPAQPGAPVTDNSGAAAPVADNIGRAASMTTPEPPVVAAPVAAERPAELPPATPATLAKVVVENLALAKELPPPVEVPVPGAAVSSKPPYPAQPGAPVTDNSGAAAPVADNIGRAASMTTPEPPVVAAPVAAERPAELPPATPATLAKVVEENLALAQELPKTVSAQPTLRTAVREEENDQDSVPQALPETVAGAVPAVLPTANAPEVSSVSGVTAKLATETLPTASSVLIEAASAVADTLLVSPMLMRGDGEIRVQLKSDVLDGAQLCIKVVGNSMQIEFAPVTDAVARLLTETQPQLIQRLAEKVPTFEVAVSVAPASAIGRRMARRGGGRAQEET